MTLDKILTWFIGTWMFLVFVLAMMSVAGLMLAAPSIWAGLLEIRDELNPFNVKYYFTLILLLSPALLAMVWRDKRRQRSKQST